MVFAIKVLNPSSSLVTNPPPRGDALGMLANGPKQMPADLYASSFTPLLLEGNRIPQDAQLGPLISVVTKAGGDMFKVASGLKQDDTVVATLTVLLKKSNVNDMGGDKIRAIPAKLQKGMLRVLDHLVQTDPKDPSSTGDTAVPGSFYLASRQKAIAELTKASMTKADAASLHLQLLMAQLDRRWFNEHGQKLEEELLPWKAWLCMAGVTADRGLHNQLLRQLDTTTNGKELGCVGVWLTPHRMEFAAQQVGKRDATQVVYGFLKRHGALRIPQTLIDFLVDQGKIQLDLERPGLIVARPGAVVELGVVELGEIHRPVTAGVTWSTGIPQTQVWKRVQPPGTAPTTQTDVPHLLVSPTEYGLFVRADVTLENGEKKPAGTAIVVLYGICARCSQEKYFGLDTMKYTWECKWRVQVQSPVFTEAQPVVLEDDAFKLATHWNRIKQVIFPYREQLRLGLLSPLAVTIAARFYYRLPGTEQKSQVANFVRQVEEYEQQALANLLTVLQDRAPRTRARPSDQMALARALSGLTQAATEASALGGDVHRMIDDIIDMDGLMREHDLARTLADQRDAARPAAHTPAEIEYRGVCRWLTSEPDPLNSIFPGSVVSNIPGFESRMRDWAESYYNSGRTDEDSVKNFNKHLEIARDSPVL